MVAVTWVIIDEQGIVWKMWWDIEFSGVTPIGE